MRAWYLQRAVPWTALLGCLATAALLVGLAHRWEALTGLVMPLVAMLGIASAAFVLDESSLAVTAVTPRARWALRGRLASAALPLTAGLALLMGAPGTAEAGDWALVVGAGGIAVMALALIAWRREVTRPGSPLASGVVLLGLVPLVLGMFFDLTSPYPTPDLADGARVFWVGLVAVTLAATLTHRRRRA